VVTGALELFDVSVVVVSCGINIGGEATDEPMLLHSPFGPVETGAAFVEVLAGQVCAGAAAVVDDGYPEAGFAEFVHGGGCVRALELVFGAAAGCANGLVNRGWFAFAPVACPAVERMLLPADCNCLEAALPQSWNCWPRF
jgi:hypothetical protein